MAVVFDSTDFAHVCAPMVRYSKLPFRTLVRSFGVDLAYTPMIIADSFASSAAARNNFIQSLTYKVLGYKGYRIL